ncbi:ElyC/SanA/YdcF family protein [Lipingzhangella sp. LS1_29]|uniref:ElyC/SanA/YdcF family protein n=1 Tax=Lipingzhangella rawalii TaxID=2055835 RepID=A0ABU2H119_9ACTN|nr:ElyC/SanA/YdcF family protein [Lipingzhangella rawalii]MDS1268998.1 ElyC/SanA/YdcF family protein [Lipingzhangella rawalii]
MRSELGVTVPRRWVTRLGWGLLVLAVTVGITGQVWAYGSSAGDRYPATAEPLPERPTALVLGAGVRDDGRPSGVLAGRLDVARDLYADGHVTTILVTGDNSPAHHHETDTMRDYLVAAGVAPTDINTDPLGLRTWDSCVRAREVFDVHAAVVVSQAFHLPRAVALCQSAGIDAVGVGHSSFDSRPAGTVHGYLREVPARIHALGTVLLRPEPHRGTAAVDRRDPAPATQTTAPWEQI